MHWRLQMTTLDLCKLDIRLGLASKLVVMMLQIRLVILKIGFSVSKEKLSTFCI